MAVSSITTLIGLVMIWCWIALWVKRLHQGGITGWMVVLLGVGWFFVNMIVGTVITLLMAPDMMSAQPEGDGFMEMMQQSMEMSRELAIPNAIAGALVSLIFVFVVNAVLPSQEGENQYGPSPAG
jgi:Predicted membrane protein